MRLKQTWSARLKAFKHGNFLTVPFAANRYVRVLYETLSYRV